MKILIDIGHPAHVHYFKNLIKIMESKGHEFLIIAKSRNVTHRLLETYKIPFIKRSDYPKSILLKLLKIPLTDALIIKHVLNFIPNLLMGFSGTHISHAGWLLKIPSIVLDDTDHARIAHLSYSFLAKVILTPTCFRKYFGKKHIKFNSYMELSYLHPNYIHIDDSILPALGVQKNEKYCIVRFVKWAASHDIGHSGLPLNYKIRLINKLSEFGKVFISSEDELPEDLRKYIYPLKPETIHNALAFASLYYGESATMASESAVLGTPAIFHDNEGRGYTLEQEEKYGIVFNFTESSCDQQLGFEKAVNILNDPLSKKKAKKISEKIIEDKIDLTSFLVWFVENYPRSIEIIKGNPEYQYNFR
jgi:uncharacterized protein